MSFERARRRTASARTGRWSRHWDSGHSRIRPCARRRTPRSPGVRMTAPTSSLTVRSRMEWSMACCLQVSTHWPHSEHSAQLRQRSASARACSSVRACFDLRRSCPAGWPPAIPGRMTGPASRTWSVVRQQLLRKRAAAFPRSGPSRRSLPFRYRSMDSAARLPAATASITDAGPETLSPPAKMPGTDVCSVTGSVLIAAALALDAEMRRGMPCRSAGRWRR